MQNTVNKKVKLELVGLDGNAFFLMGAFQRQARREKWTQEEIDADMFRRDDPDDCECIEAEEDILTGRVECFRCGRVWYN